MKETEMGVKKKTKVKKGTKVKKKLKVRKSWRCNKIERERRGKHVAEEEVVQGGEVEWQTKGLDNKEVVDKEVVVEEVVVEEEVVVGDRRSWRSRAFNCTAKCCRNSSQP